MQQSPDVFTQTAYHSLLLKALKEAVSAVTKCGASYKLPSRAALSGKLLNEAVTDGDKKLSEFKTQMSVTGATLVSDGWTNVQNRPIINYLAVTPDGAMFIDGSDTSLSSLHLRLSASLLSACCPLASLSSEL